MLEQRWLAVRERQARLRAEAETERLARAARKGRPKAASARSEAIAVAKREARMQASERLSALAAGLSADASRSRCECAEA